MQMCLQAIAPNRCDVRVNLKGAFFGFCNLQWAICREKLEFLVSLPQMTENLGPEKFHTYPKPVRFFLAFAIAARNLSRRQHRERESFLSLSSCFPKIRQCTNLTANRRAFDPLLGMYDLPGDGNKREPDMDRMGRMGSITLRARPIQKKTQNIKIKCLIFQK